MRVVTDDAVRAGTDEALDRLSALLRERGLSGNATRIANDRIEVRGLTPNGAPALRELIADHFPEWSLNRADGGAFGLELQHDDAARIRDETVDQAVRTIRRRIDSLGVREPTIRRLGGNEGERVQVQLPGVDNPDRVRELMQVSALLEFRLVEGDPFPSREAAISSYGTSLPGTLEVMGSSGATPPEWHVLEGSAAVTGRDLKTARVTRDEYGRPAVGSSLSADGSERFARLTEANVGRRLAIVLDGRVESAPGIDSRIAGSGIIQGGARGFTLPEAQDLAIVLRSGALPASLEYLADGYVSATLGADSIRSGILAGIFSLVGVVVFMVGYYRISGVIASMAMVLNILILLSILAYFDAALTLPGIAGVVLTTGVGIDSNILIFERMREEFRAGRTATASVRAGFDRVFRTLVDTHLCALLATLVLFWFGTGPVQGFAVTLSAGLVSNMFTAVFVSRTLFELLLLCRDGVPGLD